MRSPEQFVRLTFATETERITGGAVGWQARPDINPDKVTSGGILVIRRPEQFAHLAAPWPEASKHDEVMIELMPAGNPLDRRAVERALLRRQVRQVQRAEEDPAWRGDEPIWIVAPHLPEWLAKLYSPERFAPGCYQVEPSAHSFLWIAANELPLHDELIPFLRTRSDQALDELGRWLASRPQDPRCNAFRSD